MEAIRIIINFIINDASNIITEICRMMLER